VQYGELRYVPEGEDPSLTIETRELVARIIDNTGLLAPSVDSASYFNSSFRFTPFTHHLGYHGIRTLYNKTQRRNVVAAFVSWLNLQTARLEGIDPDPVDERAWAGMARGWPIQMDKAGKGAVLRLEPLPSMQMHYSLELQPVEPDGLDFSIRFEFKRRPQFGPSRFRATWPCYMNAYDDVRLFYPKRDAAGDWQWQSMGEKPAIVLGETVNYHHDQKAFFAEDQALPLGYGLVGEYALIVMFSDPRVRLFSVNAGGHSFCSPVQNPAWDFEWILEDYPLHQPVGFDGRLIYTQFEDPERVLRRYREWVDVRQGCG